MSVFGVIPIRIQSECGEKRTRITQNNLWKRTVVAEFRVNRSKLCGNCTANMSIYEILLDVWGWAGGRGGLVSVLNVQSMTRHHVEPNIDILLTRNLPFDSDVR